MGDFSVIMNILCAHYERKLYTCVICKFLDLLYDGPDVSWHVQVQEGGLHFQPQPSRHVQAH